MQWQEQTPDARPRPVSDREPGYDNPDVALQLCWTDKSRRAIYAHLGRAKVERGGLLLGRVWHRDTDPAAVCGIDIVEAVVAEASVGTPISLSIGAGVWAAARTRIEQDGSLLVVGWYHSHPGLGAFFSSTDRATQAGFFRESWHVALVVDPLRREEAWFRGPDAVQVPAGEVRLQP